MKPKTVKCSDGNPLEAETTYGPEDAHMPLAHHLLSGICADAPVVTMAGIRKVQSLRPGDLLVTRSHNVVRLTRLEECSIVTRAVYVIAGSLGHYQADRDTLLPAAQTVLVRDWRARHIGGAETMLVAAKDLVDGEYIRDIGFMPLTLYRLICDQPAVIYADGMELGTADARATKQLCAVTP